MIHTCTRKHTCTDEHELLGILVKHLYQNTDFRYQQWGEEARKAVQFQVVTHEETPIYEQGATSSHHKFIS